MKKLLTLAALGLAAMTLSSCGIFNESHELREIQITSTARGPMEDGEIQRTIESAFENPTRIAVFSDTVLDILYYSDAFSEENPLDLEFIMVPAQITHPMEQFRRRDINGITIHDAGARHLPSVNLIELLAPQVVFLDGRSFSDSPEGTLERLKNYLPNTRFVNLNFVANPAQGLGHVDLMGDTETIFNGLKAIFPLLEEGLEGSFEEIETGFRETREIVKSFNDGAPASAVWVSLNANGTITLNGFNSRWAMIHREFGFAYVALETTQNLGLEAALTEDGILAEADFIFVFAHPNAPDDLIDDFNDHAVWGRIPHNFIHIDRPSWHTAPGGISSTRQMIVDVNLGLAAARQ